METALEMKILLQEISSQAILLGDVRDLPADATWIGYAPATTQEIEAVEKQLGISLPLDFVEFLLLTNGFRAANSVAPSFCAAEKIDYLIDVDAELCEIWIDTGNEAVGAKLETAIKVGGYDEEQYFFLIPPSIENPKWEYWEFSAWLPGETIHHSLYQYFTSVLETTKSFLEHKENDL